MNKHPYPLWHPVYWLATWFHSGLAPKAPGTFGTLAAIPFAFVIQKYLGGGALMIAAIICFFLGWWVSELYVRKTGREDPKEVVIDEVAGIWLALALCPPWQGVFDWLFCLIVFFLFRLFDIWKPWPVSLADRKVKGGFGIMLDDILAAFYAFIVFIIIRVSIYIYIWNNLPPNHQLVM